MPTRSYDSRKQSDDEFFNIVKDADQKEWAMVAGVENEYEGLVTGHAYSILAAITLDGGPQILKLRNPWGKEEYKGPFSDESSTWTAAWKEQVGLVSANDGIFHIPVTGAKTAFSWYSVCMY